MEHTTKQLEIYRKRREAGDYSRMGKVGGTRTKRRMLAKDPFHFEKIGSMGGEKIMNARGREYFAELGRRGSAVTNKKRWGKEAHAEIQQG